MKTVEIKDEELQNAFAGLAKAAKDSRPIRAQIGEMMVDSTKQRFSTSTAPDGTPWAKNSPTTLMLYLGKFKGSFGKKGGLTKKGTERAGNKRPLIGETGSLASQIFYNLGDASVAWGSTMIYAAPQQFGALKHEFKGVAPWGDIPARRFLGLSGDDRSNILDSIAEYLGSAI